uniref:Uncharacterized protein n=1 Tax=Arundo donax TaxID=35708 RepID=A0A0A9GQI4_ARUDO
MTRLDTSGSNILGRLAVRSTSIDFDLTIWSLLTKQSLSVSSISTMESAQQSSQIPRTS